MKLNAPIGQIQALSALLLLLGAMAMVASSLGFQHIGGYMPCKLCYMQRDMHYALIPLSAFVLFAIWKDWPAFMIRLSFLVLCAVILYGGGIGFYQAGAEWDFWPGPADCDTSVNITKNAADLLSQLQTTKLVSCTEAQLRILGLSFAGWNAVLSSILCLIAAMGAFLPKDKLATWIAKIAVLETIVNGLHKN